MEYRKFFFAQLSHSNIKVTQISLAKIFIVFRNEIGVLTNPNKKHEKLKKRKDKLRLAVPSSGLDQA